jgi:hypothetical protein
MFLFRDREEARDERGWWWWCWTREGEALELVYARRIAAVIVLEEGSSSVGCAAAILDSGGGSLSDLLCSGTWRCRTCFSGEGKFRGSDGRKRECFARTQSKYLLRIDKSECHQQALEFWSAQDALGTQRNHRLAVATKLIS